jgi:hypothetical protein
MRKNICYSSDLFGNKTPTEITNYLGIEPSKIQIKGELSEYKSIGTIKYNGWFLTSKNSIESNDSRKHINFLTEKLLPIKDKLKTLIIEGSEIDISCFWSSKQGHGGPTLSPKQLSDLSELGIEFWFDLY